jgi:menaquinone-9 beta-reductase
VLQKGRIFVMIYDAVVIGAGPAGSSTAFHLARKGWRVALLEKSRMPRDKACGDGLGPGSVAMLESMDLGPRLQEYQHIDGVDIRVRGESTCAPSFQSTRGPAHGLVVPRHDLDLLIANRAREAGSDWYEGCRVTGFEFQNGRVGGVNFVNGKEGSIRTRFAVIADGGGSKLSAQAGIPRCPRETVGYALRGYFCNVPARRSLFSIHLPLTQPGTNRAVPGYGWIFPLKDGCANIGVGYYPRQRQDRNLNLRHLFTHFLEELVQREPAMVGMELVGKWIGGALRSGMDTSRCFANHVVVVGDAAGLVDPFTGEGIDTALVSGQYAAEALDSALKRDSEKCLQEYSHLLEHRYGDRFQLGDRFVKTYSFMWKLVQTTVDQKGPLFDKVREGLFSYSGSAPECASEDESELGRFCGSVTAEMKRISTGDFPVFSRLAMRMKDTRRVRLRQALAFWSHQVEGTEPDERLVTVSACLELAKLAHVVQAEAICSGKGNHWANSFAVMCGNYLLTKAFAAIQPLGYDLIRIVAGAAGRLCQQEIESSLTFDRRRQQRHSRVVAEIEGTFLGAAAKIGTRLAGCSPATQDRLESFGRMLGEASSYERGGAVLTGSLRRRVQLVLAGLPESKARRELLGLHWSGPMEAPVIRFERRSGSGGLQGHL